MEWKDSDDNFDLDDENADNPKSPRTFSDKRKSDAHPVDATSQPGRKSAYLLVGGGILVLLLLIAWLVSGSGSRSGAQQIASLEFRIKTLEDWVAGLGPVAGAATAIEKQEKTIADLMKRIDGLEAVLTKEIDSLSKRVATLSPQKAGSAPAKAAAVPAAPASAETQKATYHVVQAGDTLYRISRRYNLKMDELLHLNNLKAGATIRPGQRLLVHPSGR